MELKIAEKLLRENLLSVQELERIKVTDHPKLFSLYWEIKTILYLGVLLLATGIGILVYLNIDSIGHQAVLTATGMASGACFNYCYRKSPPFTTKQAKSDNLLFDYLLLLGSLLFLTFEGYFQYQYHIFGDRYGLATFIPSVILLYIAYRFDHKGVLSLAITGLAAWIGITVTPTSILKGENDFSEIPLIWTAITFSVMVSGAALYLQKINYKKHFTPTYLIFTINVLFFALLAGIFSADSKIIFFILLGVFTGGSIFYARREKSYYYFLIGSLAGYIGLTYLFFLFLDLLPVNDSLPFLGFSYFIGSCFLLVYFVINFKKLLQL